MTPQLTVEAESCGSVLRDCDKLVYIVLDQACTGGDTVMNVRLQYGANAPTTLSLRLQQELPGIAIHCLGTRQVGLFKAGEWRKFGNEGS